MPRGGGIRTVAPITAISARREHGGCRWRVLGRSLAVLALTGRSWSPPWFVRSPDPERGDSAGVFALGVFSGVASSCCAPVLAGVMTLSALSSTPVGAGVLGLAYVSGTTFPLFVIASRPPAHPGPVRMATAAIPPAAPPPVVFRRPRSAPGPDAKTQQSGDHQGRGVNDRER